MEMPELILEYVKTLVWPVTLALLLFRHRRQIDRLLDRVAEESEEVEALGWKARLRPQTQEERTERVQQEVAQIADRRPIEDSSSGAEPGRKFDMDLPPPAENARSSTGQLFNQYLLSEELVFRFLESRWALLIRREVVIELDGRQVRFDGVADTGGKLILLEVKLLTKPFLPESVIQHEVSKAVAASAYLGRPVSLYLAIVTTLPNEIVDELVQVARQAVAVAPVAVTVEGFNMGDLTKQLFGVGARAVAANPAAQPDGYAAG